MRKYSIGLLMLAAISVVGCSKDDPESNSVVTCDSDVTLEDVQTGCYFSVISTWTNMEVNGSDTTYVIRDMRPDDVLPNVYYLGADSPEDAEEFFKLHFAGDVSLQESGTDGISVNLGQYGQIHFSEGGNDPRAFATIKMQLKRMSHAVTIYFIPREALNSGNSMSPFSVGDIVRVIVGNADPKYYICTVEYGGGDIQEGRLMRWGNTDFSQNTECHYKSWYYPNNPADKVAVNGLQSLMYLESNKDRKESVISGFKDNYKDWGSDTWNCLQCMISDKSWDYNSYFISQEIDKDWCGGCWRHTRKIWIDYFYIDGGKMTFEQKYTRHQWNKESNLEHSPTEDTFKRKPQTEMVKFKGDTKFQKDGKLVELTKVWPKKGR